MDKKTQTIATYNQSARLFADKFDGLGARSDDIDETMALVKKDNPTVLEIGCGNGRDAEVICQRTKNYHGVDVSEKLIDIARERVPNGRFEVADIETYEFPGNLDVVFAFASLIHTPKEVLRQVFVRIYNSLNHDGLFRLSMKFGNPPGEVTKTDEFGVRTYHLYSHKDIEELSEQFAIRYNEVIEKRGQKWLEILLKKS